MQLKKPSEQSTAVFLNQRLKKKREKATSTCTSHWVEIPAGDLERETEREIIVIKTS